VVVGLTGPALADLTGRAFARTAPVRADLIGPAPGGQIVRVPEGLIAPTSAGPIALGRDGPTARVSTGRNVPARTGLPTVSVGRRVPNSALASIRLRDRRNAPGSKPVRGRNSNGRDRSSNAHVRSSNAHVRSNSRLVLVKVAARGRTKGRGRKEHGRRQRRSECRRAVTRVTHAQMCSASAWPRLAGVETILAAVATDAISPSAFINKMTMTIAFSQFCIAFCRSCKPCMVRERQKGKREHRGRRYPKMRHANSPASLLTGRS
jgi:hypothetical protein